MSDHRSAAEHVNEWTKSSHALAYLDRANSIPHRDEGEAALLEHLSASPGRVLDIGTGDGRLLDIVRSAHPGTTGLAIDYSPAMLAAARQRFATVEGVDVLDHDINRPLPEVGTFDAVVSSFAIHHCPDERKRSLYGEVFAALSPGGVFLNLEHVVSPSERLHIAFLTAIGYSPDTEDRSNILLDVETQLQWMRELGFEDVDCHWKWRELALLGAVRPAAG